MYRVLLLGCALPLWAQDAWVRPDPPDLSTHFRQWLRSKPATVVTTPSKPVASEPEPEPRPCAVPLKNMVRSRGPDPPMPRYKPDVAGFPMRHVQVPAPSCDDAAPRAPVRTGGAIPPKRR